MGLKTIKSINYIESTFRTRKVLIIYFIQNILKGNNIGLMWATGKDRRYMRERWNLRKSLQS